MSGRTENAGGKDEIGQKLRHARRLQKMTLKSVAEKVGCSESMLSKIELGRAPPSLERLAKLAEALGMTVASLFREEAHLPFVVYNAGERPSMDLGSRKSSAGHSTLERMIPPKEGRLLNANLHVVPPNGGSDGTLSHRGEEVGFVIEGFVELTIDGKGVLVGPGSSFFFSSTLPHSYKNIGTEIARIVWVNSPPY